PRGWSAARSAGCPGGGGGWPRGPPASAAWGAVRGGPGRSSRVLAGAGRGGGAGPLLGAPARGRAARAAAPRAAAGAWRRGGVGGLGRGASLRHAAAAIGVLVGGVYLAAQFIGVVAQGAAGYLPVLIIGNSLTTTKPETCPPHAALCPHFLSAWAGLGVLCLYAAAVLGIGAWLLARRDA